VIFVDGCFWHGRPRHATQPKNNRAFWQRKLAANKTRDRVVTRTFRAQGWRVLRIWEHELHRLKAGPNKVVQRIEKHLEYPQRTHKKRISQARLFAISVIFAVKFDTSPGLRPFHKPPGSAGVSPASRDLKIRTRRRDASAPRNGAPFEAERVKRNYCVATESKNFAPWRLGFLVVLRNRFLPPSDAIVPL
jgi:hypothetical protein